MAVVLQQRRTEGYSAGKLMQMIGVSRPTLKRWGHYFKKVFPLSNRWKRLKGLIGAELDSDVIPSILVLFFLKRFGSTEGLIRSLKLFLGGADMF